jgi:hypothetical protein
MRAKAIQLVITTLFTPVVFGQSPAADNQNRVFHFTHTETAQELQEVATVIRAISDFRQASVDPAQKTLVLRGTAAQIALADWLFNGFDRPGNRQPHDQQSADQVKREYRLSGGGDNVVRVFYLTHAGTPQALQEVATLVRSMADIRRLFTYNAPRAMTLRGTADQIALAEWLVNELDNSANRQAGAQQSQNAAPHEYSMSGGGDDVVRVYYLTHAGAPQNLQDIAVHVRSTAQVPRLFIYNAPRAMALRGTAEQIALADRLIKESDK